VRRVAEIFLATAPAGAYVRIGRKIFGLGRSGESRVALSAWTADLMSPPVFRPKFPYEKEVILV
jgi:hypothetical protein